MKRLLALALCVLLLAGCGLSAPLAQPAATPEPTAAPAAAPSATAAPAPTMPLTGLAGAAGASLTARPAAVMVGGSATATARQWGIADASVVIEALTEGKTVSRMLWFDSLAAVPKVGPVAGGRDVFWQLVLPQNTITVQKGMDLYTENLLDCYAWQPLDALALGVNCFDYDSSDPAAVDEDCWYAQGVTLANGLPVYGISAEGDVPRWQQFGTASAGAGAAASLTVAYSDTSATILKWENGAYAMYRTDGTPQLDANTGAQAAFANAVVLYASAGVKDNKYTRDYDLTGGSGLYLTGGTWQAITWKKGGAAAPLQLLDAAGAPLTLTAGKTYLGIWGGFAGQSLTLADAAGTAVETGLAAPAPIATPVPTPEPTPDPAAAAPAAASVPAA